MNYAIISDNKISAFVNSAISIDKLRAKYPDADRIEHVSDSFPPSVGTDARAIDWITQTVKPLSALVLEGIVTVPEGSKLDGEKIRPMTQVERIEAGLDTLPAGWKIADGKLLPMTRDERFCAGQITAAQYNIEVRAERRVRYAMDADPLYMEYLYDSESKRDTAPAKKQAWIAKVDEIKAALPLKGE